MYTLISEYYLPESENRPARNVRMNFQEKQPVKWPRKSSIFAGIRRVKSRFWRRSRLRKKMRLTKFPKFGNQDTPACGSTKRSSLLTRFILERTVKKLK